MAETHEAVSAAVQEMQVNAELPRKYIIEK